MLQVFSKCTIYLCSYLVLSGRTGGTWNSCTIEKLVEGKLNKSCLTFCHIFEDFSNWCAQKTLKNFEKSSNMAKKLGDKMKEIIIQPIKYTMEIPKPEIQVFLGTYNSITKHVDHQFFSSPKNTISKFPYLPKKDLYLLHSNM